MSLETDLVAYLNGVSEITALVDGRIMPWPQDQNPEFPLLTYFRVTGSIVSSLTSGSSGLLHTEMQFDCWSRRRIETWDLAEALKEALLGFSGTMGSTVVGPILFRDERDFYEEEDEVARRMMRLGIWYCEDPINNIQP